MSKDIQKQAQAVLSKLSGVKQTANGWSAKCPVHDGDDLDSLSVAVKDDRILLNCHSKGCKVTEIVTTLGLKEADLFTSSTPSRKKDDWGKMVEAYGYEDESGALLFEVCRFEKTETLDNGDVVRTKTFRQRKLDGDRSIWAVKGVRQVLYKLPVLLKHTTGAIHIVEGEKDVLNLMKLGLLATTSPGGAGKWRDEFSQALAGRFVVILPDNDDVGREHAEEVAQSVWQFADSVRIVELPDLPEKGDVTDWIDAGGTREQLRDIVASTPQWEPEQASWPEVVPIGPPLPTEFPVSALPPILKEWVEAESIATQTPVDLPAMLGIAVGSAAIARKIEVQPQPDWREPVNLYSVVLLDPGDRKSAVFNDAMAPMRATEQRLAEAAASEVAKAASIRRQDQNRLNSLEKKATKEGGRDTKEEAVQLAIELNARKDPVGPKLIVDDATSEKLGMILAEQGGRIASMSPEGGVFDLMAGMYSKSGIPQIDTYLKGHAGDEIRVERISRSPVYVERPAITIAYAIQPEVLRSLTNKSTFRGRGLIGRFLYACPESRIGEREVRPPAVPESVRNAYSELIEWLIDQDPQHETSRERPVLSLDDAADKCLTDWMERLEESLGDGGELSTMRDWGAKLAGQTLRIAAVFHFVKHFKGRPWEIAISADTLNSAIEVATYAIRHAEIAIFLMSRSDEDDDPGPGAAESVWKWIRRNGNQTFSKRDLHRGVQRRFRKAESLDTPLTLLVERGYIRPVLSKATSLQGRPKSPVYEVNPAALEREKPALAPRQRTLTEVTETTEEAEGTTSVTCVNDSDHSAPANSEDWGPI